MFKNKTEVMFGLIKKVFITSLSCSGSLAYVNNVTDFTKWTSLNNQPSMTRSILADLNPDEYNERLGHFPFMVNLDVIEVEILLMNYLVEYVFEIKQKIKILMFLIW